jgi:hypothetical protein
MVTGAVAVTGTLEMPICPRMSPSGFANEQMLTYMSPWVIALTNASSDVSWPVRLVLLNVAEAKVPVMLIPAGLLNKIATTGPLVSGPPRCRYTAVIPTPPLTVSSNSACVRSALKVMRNRPIAGVSDRGTSLSPVNKALKLTCPAGAVTVITGTGANVVTGVVVVDMVVVAVRVGSEIVPSGGVSEVGTTLKVMAAVGAVEVWVNVTDAGIVGVVKTLLVDRVVGGVTTAVPTVVGVIANVPAEP